ncbi:hypothetical protein AT246_03085 [Bartonella henselae]|nr:hypothetical protein AT241_02160 [Bartonella henselae]OLL51449.1 hypothetical protein AT247_03950 [Bartonella henselae]OLL51946.1 hypothetical protein AT243_05665 [Bartonella henselae]OLL55247.1 hypothetical protein AT239_00610 [Bartonella henselae]OLL56493.1 hypothetical protein AT246_03085 [Bartonella henselae]
MNNKKFYGKRFHQYTFAEAVDNKLLTPYKIIIVLDIDDEFITLAIQNIIANKIANLILMTLQKLLATIEHLPK